MTESFKRNFGLGLLTVSILSLICFGIVGIGRDGLLNGDGGVLYAAGRAWLNGLNAYNHDILTQSVAAIKEIDNLKNAAFSMKAKSSQGFQKEMA